MVSAIALAIALVAASPAAAAPSQDSAAAWCDVGKNEYLHVQRGRAIVRRAYDRDRYPDRRPMRPPEKFALRQHKFCLRSPALRWRIERYRNRAEKRYDAYRKRRAERELYADLIDPPGASYLAGLRACECRGYADPYDVDSTYDGAYQFDLQTWGTTASAYKRSGWPEPAAASPLSASPEQQDIRAAILYRARGSSPWPICG